MSKPKKASSEEQAKSVWLILKATDRGMTSKEIYEHPMFKAVAVSPMSLGQVLAHMKKKHTILRSRGSTATAKWSLAKIPKEHLTVERNPSDPSMLRVTLDRSTSTLVFDMGGTPVALTIR